MSQYKTTNGRPASFKFGPVNIRIGKKPVEIDSKYAERILKQYPGWIERVGPAEIDTEELEAQTQETETEALTETAVDDHQDAPAAEKSEPETSTQETEATAETMINDQSKAAEPDPVPAAIPVPAATPASKKESTGKTSKKSTEKKVAEAKA